MTGVQTCALPIYYASLTPEEFQEIEERANAYVIADIPVDSYIMNRTDAEKKFGMRLYQEGAVPGRELRIIDVRGVDVEACGGIHCSRTTEIGPIKLLRSRRIQDGVLRLEFIAGRPLVEWMKTYHDTVSTTGEILGVSHDKITETIGNIHREWKEFHRVKKKDQKKDTSSLKEELLASAENIDGIRYIQV